MVRVDGSIRVWDLKERKVGYCIRSVRGASRSPVASLYVATYRITVGHEHGDLCVIDFRSGSGGSTLRKQGGTKSAATPSPSKSGKSKKRRKEAARLKRRGGGAAASNRRHLRDLKALCNNGKKGMIDSLQFDLE